MADENCYVSIVFKGGERTSVWMTRATLDQLASDFAQSGTHSIDRKIYPLTELSTNPSLSPRVLVLTLQDIAYIN